MKVDKKFIICAMLVLMLFLCINASCATEPLNETLEADIADELAIDDVSEEPLSASGDTIVVDKNGGGQYTSISEAVGAATGGETILVKNGEYSESNTITIQNSVNIVGESQDGVKITGASTTLFTATTDKAISVGLNNLTILNAGSGSNVAIKFTYSAHDVEITNCIFDNCGSKWGTIQLGHPGTANVDNCKFLNSKCTTSGGVGAIYLSGEGTFNIKNTLINNSMYSAASNSYMYGVIYAYSKTGVTTLDNVTISNCNVPAQGIINAKTKVTVKNSKIENNTVTQFNTQPASVFYAYYNSNNPNGELIVEQSVISNNVAAANFNHIVSTSKITVNYCNIHDNTYATFASSAGTIDYEANYWGSNDLPSGVTASTWVVENNGEYTLNNGNALEKDIPELVSTDVPTDGGIIYVSNDGDAANDGKTKETAVDSIETAYELASEGSSIYLVNGNYELESLELDKSVSFVGESTLNTILTITARRDAIATVSDIDYISFENMTINAGRGGFVSIENTVGELNITNCIIKTGGADLITFTELSKLNAIGNYFYQDTDLAISGDSDCDLNIKNNIFIGEMDPIMVSNADEGTIEFNYANRVISYATNPVKATVTVTPTGDVDTGSSVTITVDFNSYGDGTAQTDLIHDYITVNFKTDEGTLSSESVLIENGIASVTYSSDVAGLKTIHMYVEDASYEIGTAEINVVQAEVPSGVIYVSTTGDDSKDGLTEANAVATLKHAIEIADAGKIVILAGEYTQTQFLNITKDLDITGEGDVTIKSNSRYSIEIWDDWEEEWTSETHNTLIENNANLNLTNIKFTLVPASIKDPLILNNANLYVNTCEFSNIKITSGKGVIQNSKGAELEVNGTTFQTASSTYGAINNNGELLVNNSKFLDNDRSSDSGVYSTAITSYNKATILNSEFKNNKGTAGGAVYVMYSYTLKVDPVVMEINNCTFEQNNAPGTSYSDGTGAAVKCSGSQVTLTITNSTFKNNNAKKGGAVFAAGTVTIDQCVFVGNTASMGEAVYVDSGSTTVQNSIILDGTSSVWTSSAAVTANDNWWGTNDKPTPTDGVTIDAWVKMDATMSPSQPNAGDEVTVTATFDNDKLPDGVLEVTFTSTSGNLNEKVTVNNAQASVTYTIDANDESITATSSNAIVVIPISAPAQNTIYVSNAGDDNNDGLTKDTAVATLYKALEIVPEGGVIYLLNGVYKVDRDSDDVGLKALLIDKSVSFVGEDVENTVIDFVGEGLIISDEGVIEGFSPIDFITFENITFDKFGSESVISIYATVGELNITNCRFVDSPSQGILMIDSVSKVSVSHSILTMGESCIYTLSEAEFDIHNNAFLGYTHYLISDESGSSTGRFYDNFVSAPMIKDITNCNGIDVESYLFANITISPSNVIEVGEVATITFDINNRNKSGEITKVNDLVPDFTLRIVTEDTKGTVSPMSAPLEGGVATFTYTNDIETTDDHFVFYSGYNFVERVYISTVLTDPNIYVLPGASNDNPGTRDAPVGTIARALEIATKGQIVLLEGTHKVNDLGTISEDLTITGEGKAIIDAQNNGRILYVGSEANVVINNVTMINGYTSDASGALLGNNNNLTLINCILANSSTGPDLNGGAIYSSGKLTIINTTIANCSAREGGAIFTQNPLAKGNTIKLINSTLENNKASGNDNLGGGAIFAQQITEFTIENSSFIKNEAGTTASGGAIFISHSSADVKITDSKFIGNHANGQTSTGGGAIYRAPTSNYQKEGTMTITGTLFENNTCDANGGAIYARGTTVNIANSVLVNNTDADGLAVYGYKTDTVTPTITLNDNWWGSNDSPKQLVGGNGYKPTLNRWAILTITNDTPIVAGETVKLTVSINNYTDGSTNGTLSKPITVKRNMVIETTSGDISGVLENGEFTYDYAVPANVKYIAAVVDGQTQVLYVVSSPVTIEIDDIEAKKYAKVNVEINVTSDDVVDAGVIELYVNGEKLIATIEVHDGKAIGEVVISEADGVYNLTAKYLNGSPLFDDNEKNATLTVSGIIELTNSTFFNFFDADGLLRDEVTEDELVFHGDFSGLGVNTITIPRGISIKGDNAVLYDMAISLQDSDIKVSDMKFIADGTDFTMNAGAVILAVGENIELNNVTVDYTAPGDVAAYAILANSANNFKLVDSTIKFDANNNAALVQQAAVVVDGSNDVEIKGNTINATLPSKDVAFNYYYPDLSGIYQDLVLGIGIQGSENINFTDNEVNVDAKSAAGSYATLDSFMLDSSKNVLISGNNFTQTDFTGEGKAGYSNVVDLYNFEGVTVQNNNILINTSTGVEGAGTAYPIQATGPYTGLVIDNNNLTAISKGPALGIYSQNYDGVTDSIITNNNINATGYATANAYALVSGMELQDTNAKVYNNTIYSQSIGSYGEENALYGISYAQYTSGTHTYDIKDNTIYTDGKYAVSLQSAQNTNVTGNTLYAHELAGDDSVNIGTGEGNIVKDNVPPFDVEILIDADNVWIGTPSTVVVNITGATGTVTIKVNEKEFKDLVLVDGIVSQIVDAADLVAGKNNVTVTFTSTNAELKSGEANATFWVLDGVVTQENYMYYFNQEDNGKLFDYVPEGATLDFQGKIINPDQNNVVQMNVNKPVNIVSTTEDGYVDLNTTSGSLFGESPGNSFAITYGGSGSNVTGITLHNTQVWITNTSNVVVDNVSIIVEDQRIGSGVGVTSVRDNSTNVTIKNSYFFTKNNGMSTTFTFSWANNCTFDNNTVKVEGNVGNLVYLNVYNIDLTNYPNTYSSWGSLLPISPNNYNKIINNKLYGKEGSGVSVGLMVEGTYNLIQNNTFYKCSSSNSMGAKDANHNTYVGNTFLNGGSLTAQAGSVVYNNNVSGSLTTGANSVAYNNTVGGAFTATAGDATVAYNNTIGGALTVAAGATVYNNTAASLKTSGANSVIKENIINGAVTISHKNTTFANNNVSGLVTVNADENRIINNTIIVDGDNTVDLKAKKNNNVTGNILYASELTGDASVKFSDESNIVKDNYPIIPDVIVEAIDVIEGQSTTITVTVPNATGNVTIRVNNKEEVVNLTDGVAIFETSEYGDNVTVNVTYNGDLKYLPNTNVTAFKFITELTVSAKNTTVGNDVIIEVEFNENAEGIVTIIVDGKSYSVDNIVKGKGNITISNLTASDYTVGAKFVSTSDKYTDAENSTVFNVAKTESDVNITVSDAVLGENATITVSIPGATGTVAVIVNGKEEVIPLDENGNATYTIEDISAGDYNVVAIYSGDKDHEFAYAAETFTVDKLASEVNVTVKAGKAGEKSIIEFNVTDGATGTVIIDINGTKYAVDVADGKLEVVLDAGSYPVVASYSGDDKYDAKVSEEVTLDVAGKLPANIEIIVPEEAKVGETITIKVTADTDANLVVIINGDVQEINATNGPNGMTTINILRADNSIELAYTIPKAGIYNITVSADETPNYMAQTVTKVLEATKKDAVITIDEINDVKVGDKVTITVVNETDGALTIKVNGETVTGEYEITKVGPYTVTVESAATKSYNAGFATYTFQVTEPANITVIVDGVEYNITPVNGTTINTGLPEELEKAKQNITNLTKQLEEAKDNASKLADELKEAKDNITELAGKLADAEANATKLADELKEANDNITELAGKLADAEANATKLADNLADANAKVDNLTKELANAKDNATKLADELADAEANATKLADELKEANDNIAELVGKLADAEANATKLADELKEANDNIAELSGKLADAEANATKLAEDLADANAKVDNLTKELANAKDNATKLAEDLVDANAKVDNLTGELADANAKVDNLTDELDDAKANATKLADDLVDANKTIDELNRLLEEALANKTKTVVVDGKEYPIVYVDGVATVTTDPVEPVKLIGTKIEADYSFTRQANDYNAGERGEFFYAVLKDINDKPLANMTCYVAVNGPIYTVTTDDQGRFGVRVNLAEANTYTYALSFLGNDKYSASFNCTKLIMTAKKTSITAKAKTYKVKAKKTYSVTLKTVKNPYDGKTYLKAGKKVKLTVNGKTYTAKTNSKGVAKFTLKLTKKGKYTAKIKFAGDKTYKASSKSVKITIK